MSKEQLMDLIESYDEIDLQVYNDLIKKYGKGNVCIALQKIAESARNKEELQEILRKYASAYISMEADSKEITEEEYEKLLSKYGEEAVVKYLEEKEELLQQIREKTFSNRDSNSYASYINDVKNSENAILLTPDQEKQLFRELDMLRKNLNIATIEDNQLSFNNIYAVLHSVSNASQIKKLSKLSSKLNLEQKEILEKYLKFVKENNKKNGIKDYVPSNNDLNKLFGKTKLSNELINVDDLNSQLDNITDIFRIVNKIWEANLRSVIKYAKHYNRFVGSDEFYDLIQEGNIGLFRAIDKFDVTKGYKFSTYAYWWTRQTMSRYLSENVRTIRLPVFVVELSIKAKYFREYLAREKGIVPSDEEVARYLNTSVDRLKNIEASINNSITTSIDAPARTSESGEPSPLSDFIEDERVDLESDVIKEDAIRILLQEINALEYRQRIVAYQRFGIYHEKYNPEGRVFSLEEVGQELHVTRERIRQIEVKLLRNLRRSRNVRALAPNYIVANKMLEDSMKEEKVLLREYRRN